MTNQAVTQRFSTWARLLGLFAAGLALAGQLALGAVIPRAEAQVSAIATLASVSLICHAGHPSTTGSKPLRHHSTDLRLSALAQAAAQSASLAAPPSLGSGTPLALALPILWPLRAGVPHIAFRLTPQPRGPPSLA